VDYTSTPITATFPAGTNSTTISVPVTMDNIAEQSETFDLSLTITGENILPGDIIRAIGNITDATSKIMVLYIHMHKPLTKLKLMNLTD